MVACSDLLSAVRTASMMAATMADGTVLTSAGTTVRWWVVLTERMLADESVSHLVAHSAGYLAASSVDWKAAWLAACWVSKWAAALVPHLVVHLERMTADKSGGLCLGELSVALTVAM